MPRQSQKLVKHGTRAGYDAELAANGPGGVCERCKAAKRVYQSQYYKVNKDKGIKYRSDEVIDHLDKTRTRTRHPTPADGPTARAEHVADGPGQSPDTPANEPLGQAESATAPNLADRLTAGLRLFAQTRQDDSYVETDEIPDYLKPLDPDAESSDEGWSKVKIGDEEYIITKEGMVLIEENLGTYLSIIGMTFELVDPYCGRLLGENLDEIVKRWAKIISHYPKAAKIFLAKEGGILMDWIAGIQAIWPVLFGIYEHHLAKTVITENGRTMRVVSPNGQRPDATTPEYEYTVGPLFPRG